MWNLSSPVDKSNEFDVDNKYTTTIFFVRMVFDDR